MNADDLLKRWIYLELMTSKYTYFFDTIESRRNSASRFERSECRNHKPHLDETFTVSEGTLVTGYCDTCYDEWDGFLIQASCAQCGERDEWGFDTGKSLPEILQEMIELESDQTPTLE